MILLKSCLGLNHVHRSPLSRPVTPAGSPLSKPRDRRRESNGRLEVTTFQLSRINLSRSLFLEERRFQPSHTQRKTEDRTDLLVLMGAKRIGGVVGLG
jgi:hypothetical protein